MWDGLKVYGVGGRLLDGVKDLYREGFKIQEGECEAGMCDIRLAI